MRTKALYLVMVLVLALSTLSGCAQLGLGGSQEAAYPEKQITYLIAFDPGGQSDRRARLQQPELERILGQKVLIDYKAGGGGALGWSELVKAKPDGYFTAGINIPHIILQPLQQETGFKTEQIVPVALFERTPLGLAVLKTSPYTTLQEFVDAAKANPGSISIGGSGTFSGHHMATLWLQDLTGATFNYVPFTGAAPQMTAFLGGHVDAVFANSDDLVKNFDQLRVLGIGSDGPFEALPGAPTFKDGGFDIAIGIERGVAVPAGTPDYVIKKLEAAFLEIHKDAAVQAEMSKQGFEPLAMGHDEAKAYIEKMTKVYTDLAKQVQD
ncbi:MAG: tripartite tricarboxylate transporter substrate binding protein [Chloroflexi bacterium]|nr:tripartite tricarboxylate transporter substrate binding protein [Chloroflexota bacterium]